MQLRYNKKHGIVPRTIEKKIQDRIIKEEELDVSEMDDVPKGDIFDALLSNVSRELFG